MKILIVNTSDIEGGAARAAYRLHKALRSQGVDSQMLVQNKSSDDYTVIAEKDKVKKTLNKLRPFFDSIPVRFYKNRTKTLFSSSWLPFSNIVNKINEINPDIVHLHWICGGMLKIEDLKKIKKPIVWTLHDNWAFTGGCHIKWDCDKYKDICGACPVLSSNKEYDLSRRVWERKNKTFKKLNNIMIVCPSRWLTNLSKESRLLGDKEHINIPNLIDTNSFKPFDKDRAKGLWNLPKDKRLILFGAMNATSDINKGFNILMEALNLLKIDNVEFVVFGSCKPKNPPDFKFKSHYVGHLNDDISLVTLYNTVDVMVVPSIQENLSNAIMENLACGTPVVAFDIGGNGDMIEHKINGYLAKPYESKDLAEGIEWVLNLPIHDYDKLCENARRKVVEEFDSKIVVKKYIDLYREILNCKT